MTSVLGYGSYLFLRSRTDLGGFVTPGAVLLCFLLFLSSCRLNPDPRSESSVRQFVLIHSLPPVLSVLTQLLSLPQPVAFFPGCKQEMLRVLTLLQYNVFGCALCAIPYQS